MVRCCRPHTSGAAVVTALVHFPVKLCETALHSSLYATTCLTVSKNLLHSPCTCMGTCCADLLRARAAATTVVVIAATHTTKYSATHPNQRTYVHMPHMGCSRVMNGVEYMYMRACGTMLPSKCLRGCCGDCLGTLFREIVWDFAPQRHVCYIMSHRLKEPTSPTMYMYGNIPCRFAAS